MPEREGMAESKEEIQMFRTRLLSGIVLVVLALFLIITGGDVLLGALLLVSLIGMYELYRVFHVEKSTAGIFGYAAAVIFYAALRQPSFFDLQSFVRPETAQGMAFVMGLLICLMFVYVFAYPRYKTEQILAVFFGVFYVAVMLSGIYQTRMLNRGEYIVWLIFLCSWGCDTCAYCVGVLIGKHKMSPKLSPKKSIEGAVGGVLGSMLLTMLYVWVFREPMRAGTQEMLLLSGICGVGALISMVGDLAASAIKRNYEIKDYGKLIPGHGGILDRFDSVIFTAPVIYYLAAYLIK